MTAERDPTSAYVHGQGRARIDSAVRRSAAAMANHPPAPGVHRAKMEPIPGPMFKPHVPLPQGWPTSRWPAPRSGTSGSRGSTPASWTPAPPPAGRGYRPRGALWAIRARKAGTGRSFLFFHRAVCREIPPNGEFFFHYGPGAAENLALTHRTVPALSHAEPQRAGRRGGTGAARRARWGRKGTTASKRKFPCATCVTGKVSADDRHRPCVTCRLRLNVRRPPAADDPVVRGTAPPAWHSRCGEERDSQRGLRPVGIPPDVGGGGRVARRPRAPTAQALRPGRREDGPWGVCFFCPPAGRDGPETPLPLPPPAPQCTCSGVGRPILGAVCAARRPTVRPDRGRPPPSARRGTRHCRGTGPSVGSRAVGARRSPGGGGAPAPGIGLLGGGPIAPRPPMPRRPWWSGWWRPGRPPPPQPLRCG
jgi:hypothetical protein